MPYNTDIHAASKPKLAKKKLNMYVGESYKFKNKGCKFSSSDKKVVSVNTKGKVKAKKPGNAKITVKSKKNGKKSICNVKVGRYIKSLTLNSANVVTLKPGQTSQIRLTIAPSGVLYSDIIYNSSDVNIATVSSTGLITPVSVGITEITATSKAVNSKKKTISTKITVVVMNATDNIQGTVNSTNPPIVVEDKPDLIDTQDGFDIIVTPVVIPTRKPSPEYTATPTPFEDSPSSTPDVSPSSTPGATDGGVTPTPAATSGTGPTSVPSPTNVPTAEPTPSFTPVPTVEPTQRPVTMQEYIDSLNPSDNDVLAGSIVVANAFGKYRTLYFINKNYTGNMKVAVDGYSYATNGNVTEFLDKLQNDTGGVTNSAETVKVSRRKRGDAWAIQLLKEGIVYYISGSVNDKTYGSPYGIITADGDTLEHINICEQ